ncbi:ParB/RepB/Spo0J family partition protein [Mesorhizobium sp. ES1-1]|uniref:ParB/RepB/Spo0J family partition protein n=1 Tax=Mesorhizobium sp. ES1-1 TaxID=2876629 RepID=UPI001CC90FDF|nr:ParB N-terminal domain-containing protein [Mesorhizobium sp. ES1-1]MBZ9678934.1 ParB N-terminal domain-containing protein [Mesorhizobium sp. ES1-1]
MTTTTKIKIADLRVPRNRRRTDPAWVATLMADMQAGNGHMVPIEVVPETTEGYQYRLILGAHRLEAVAGLGHVDIDAFIRDPKEVANEAQMRKREIAENLIRRQLSVLDRSRDIADWRDIYDAENGTGKAGRRKAREVVEDDELSAKFALNFSEAAQSVLGISRRSVFHALKIATIPSAIRESISLHPVADSQADLLVLAAEPAERQAAIAKLLLADPAEAFTVADAIALLDKVPAPIKEPTWQKVATAFSKMKEGDQDRFFALHEAAIQRWLKGRQP